MVTMASPARDKLALYADRFRARADVHAVRWENAGTGQAGWMPAVAGGWRKGIDRRHVDHLPLTDHVIVHEAMVLRGSMDLRSYDRLFPNQDVLPDGGFGNLIAAPLQDRRRRDGLTVFLDLATLEPYEDQWLFLSTVDRLSPGEAQRVARAAPISFAGLLVQYAGRVVRAAPGKDIAEVHDYHDHAVAVLATSLQRRMPGYRSRGFTKP
jgi:hypothetical protein